MFRFAKYGYYALIAVVLALAGLFLGTQLPLFGYEVKVVQSGSMEPTIPFMSVVVIAPQSSYGVGDVITFGEDTAKKIPITHRIVAERVSAEGTQFVTKGDANEDADRLTVGASAIIGSVSFSIPYIGYAIEFLRTPLGYSLLVGIPALIIVLDEIANITWEFHKHRARRRRTARQTASPTDAKSPVKPTQFSPHRYLEQPDKASHYDIYVTRSFENIQRRI